MSKIVVHHLELSRSFRVLWLLDELNVDYEIKHYKRDPKASNGPQELLKVHPLGKSPAVTINATVVTETGAIFEYLLHEYDKSHKLSSTPGSQEQNQINYWLHYSEGSLMSVAVLAFILLKGGADASGPLQQIDLNLKFLEEELTKHEWFAGDRFSAADINLEFPLEFVEAIPEVTISKFPKLTAWKEKIKKRPAYQKALEKNGPYNVKALF